MLGDGKGLDQERAERGGVDVDCADRSASARLQLLTHILAPHRHQRMASNSTKQRSERITPETTHHSSADSAGSSDRRNCRDKSTAASEGTRPCERAERRSAPRSLRSRCASSRPSRRAELAALTEMKGCDCYGRWEAMDTRANWRASRPCGSQPDSLAVLSEVESRYMLSMELLDHYFDSMPSTAFQYSLFSPPNRS